LCEAVADPPVRPHRRVAGVMNQSPSLLHPPAARDVCSCYVAGAGTRHARNGWRPAVVTLEPLKRSLAAMLCACLLTTALPRTGAAQAIMPDRTREVRAACAPDYFRLCRDVLPGGGRIIACMNQNADKLSPRCFQALTAWGLAAANAFRACLPDAERF